MPHNAKTTQHATDHSIHHPPPSNTLLPSIIYLSSQLTSLIALVMRLVFGSLLSRRRSQVAAFSVLLLSPGTSITGLVTSSSVSHSHSRRFSRLSITTGPPYTRRSRIHQHRHRHRHLATMASSNTETTFVSTSDPVDAAILPSWMRKERTRMLTSDATKYNKKGKSVVYWMQRDVRTVDNWALLFAAHLAETNQVPLHVIHVLPPPPPLKNDNSSSSEIPTMVQMPMTERHGTFLLGGLKCVYDELTVSQVPLHIILPLSHRLVGDTLYSKVLQEIDPQVVICDFSPLRHIRQWMELQTLPLLETLEIPLWQVDTHNVVPVWHASDKRQVGARTLRPRINKVVSEFLQKYPKFQGNQHIPKSTSLELPEFTMQAYQDFLQMDPSVPALPWATPGTDAAKKQFTFFVQNGLANFDTLRNDPTHKSVCSNLSPWLNHGHMSFQRCVMAVKKLNTHASGTASFVEEGLIRKELSDNLLFYSPLDYDSLTTAAGWAQETLQTHASDPREYLYSLEELEEAKTHDDLWNAAQMQVVQEGQMHGFLRMYWAKKILEWTESPEFALKAAQYFNDKYALDGRDPNGFVGVGWSIMGIHDMGWKEREIFGKIRFMNYKGCKRKFKVDVFVKKYKGASENAIAAEAKAQAAKSKKRKTPA